MKITYLKFHSNLPGLTFYKDRHEVGIKGTQDCWTGTLIKVLSWSDLCCQLKSYVLGRNGIYFTLGTVNILRFEILPPRILSLIAFKHENEGKLAGPTGKLDGPAHFMLASSQHLMQSLGSCGWQPHTGERPEAFEIMLLHGSVS